MARAKRTATKVIKQPVQTQGSRFPNFLLGLTFLIVILLLISLFFKNSGFKFSPSQIAKLFTRSNSSTAVVDVHPTAAPSKAVAGEDYTVKDGDTLWMIAEEAYGSGFNMTDIATANKLPDPGQIQVGQHITLPKVEAKSPTRGEVVAQNYLEPTQAAVTQAPSSSGQKEYVVQKGDCLWTIAEKTYGDGLMWVKISNANNLANPRIIHKGNRLILPAA